MKALILAAGLGTRLRPLTETRAKPSLPVMGVPALWYAVHSVKRELDQVAFAMNVCHAPETLRKAGDDAELKAFTGVSFQYSDETSGILGSSGALKGLASWIGEDTLMVSNADSICFPSWRKMIDFHRSKKALITLHVRSFEREQERYTDVEIGSRGEVTRFGEKAHSGMMFTGCYIFEPELLAKLPDGPSELRTALLEPLAARGKLFAFFEETPWFDIGTIRAYAKTQFELLKQIPSAKPLIEAKMREARPGCWVPKDWPQELGGLELTGPVILTGDLAKWASCAKKFGPRFLGIEPPEASSVSLPSQSVLVCSNHIEKL